MSGSVQFGQCPRLRRAVRIGVVASALAWMGSGVASAQSASEVTYTRISPRFFSAVARPATAATVPVRWR